jgi:hypothetical protein
VRCLSQIEIDQWPKRRQKPGDCGLARELQQTSDIHFFPFVSGVCFMISIPYGGWAIQSVLINDTTVMNNEGVRAIEVLEHEWVLQPSGQPLQVVILNSTSAILRSNGDTYDADFEVNGNHLTLHISRRDLNEKVTFEAESITADVFVNVVQ